MVMTADEKLATMNMVNMYRTYDKATGKFVEWKPNTPDFVKQAYQHLMVEVGANNNEGATTNGQSNDVSTQPRGSSGQSPNVPEGKQAAGIQADERQETAGIRRSGGEESGEIRSESNIGGDVRERSVEHSDQEPNTRVGNGLDLHPEPLIPGAEASTPPKDIILTSSSDIGYNLGAATKFDANLEAIRTLKKIEAESRKATPAEQAILARYSGFGDSAFNDAFDDGRSYHPNQAMVDRGEKLKELCTDDEFKAIETSRINAFFTTPEVINSMWSALGRMGVNNLSHPHLLEPSAGSGRFFGYEPVELASRSERIAIEKDKLTGRMLRQLYPQTAVYVMGYEETPIPAESVDLAISNVPFGNVSVFDPSFKGDKARFKKSIHNYFFGKTLKQLRPGGVLAFITTHNTLDAPSAQPVRELMAEEANFLGAIRLPAKAFPDTDVVTDIIFMKKRMAGEPKGDTDWTQSVNMKVKRTSGNYNNYDIDVNVNKYFVDHPIMVCGKHTGNGQQYRGDSYSVDKLEGSTLSSLMANAVNQLPANVIQDMPSLSKSATAIPSGLGINEGARVIKEGVVYVNHNQQLEKVDLSNEETTRIKSMLAIRDAAKEIVRLELANCGDNELADAQKKLNELYDAYVAKHGAMNNGKNRTLLSGDPDMPFLRALEKDDKDHPIQDIAKLPKLPAEKAREYKMPIFDRRTINGYRMREVKSEADAVAVSMNEKGRLDLDYMADLLGTSKEQVINSLSAKGKIFKNPIGDWESADVYLTGEVREKLRIAEASAQAKSEFQPNVDALKAVQPKDLPPSQINAQLGAHWIPPTDVDAFVKFLLSPYGNWRRNHGEDKWFDYVPQTGEWVKSYDGKMDANSSKLESEWGTHRMSADNLILRILNGSTIEVMDRGDDDKPVRNAEETVAAQEKAALIKTKFKEWIWQDAERADRLVKNYNTIFNGTRPRIFDGSHQEFPAMALKWKRQMHKHQKDAVWRVVQDRTTLLAHEVGFGKTAVMVAGGMELKRLGIAGKPLYVVPKSTHKQFYDQFKDVYPYANVLFPEEDDFSVGKRQEFISRIMTGNWDAVILSNEQLKAIPLKPETEIGFIKQEIEDIREAIIGVEPPEEEGNGNRYTYRRERKEKESASHKELQKALLRAETRLKNAMEKVHEHADNTVFFEDLGVDQLFVDEADNFKNLHFTTNMGRLKGLPNTDSTRAFDMYMKVRALQQRGKNVGVTFATGTPVANTIAEMYTMMRYLQQPMLEAKGLKHFDAWAHTFGETIESLEQTPTGQYKMAQRFAKFNNAPELSKLWQDVTDIRVADEVPQMVALRPRIVDDNGKPRRTVISAPPTKDLLLYMEDLARRASDLGAVDPRVDNMLKISNDARLASLDMRMVDPRAKPNPQGKIALAARKIAEVYNKENANKGTQLVFLDLGTPKASEKVETVTTVDGGDAIPDENEETEEEMKVLRNCYAVLKDYLIAAGIPEKEVRFIHDAKSNAQRKSMMDKVNAGDVRVIIGSTGKLGTGVNMQERACALHHLDAPWRPRDIEQREGRVIRQGNKLYGAVVDEETGDVVNPGKGVHIYTYVTERSFDGYMWQAIEAKSKAIKSIMRRDNPPREIEDIDSFTMSAGEAKAIATGNPDVMKEASLKNSINRLMMLQASHTDNIVRAHNQMSALPKEIESCKSDVIKMADDATMAANYKSNVFKMTVGNKEFTEDTIAAGEALKAGLTSSPTVTDYNQIPKIGSYKGFDIYAHNQGSELGYRLIVRNPKTMLDYSTLAIPYAELNAKGLVARINNKIDGIPAALEVRRGVLEQAEKNLANYRKQAEAPFEYAPRLTNMQKELSEVQDRLKNGKVSPTTTENIDTSLPEELNEEEPLSGEQPTYQFHAKDEGELPPPRELTTNPTAEAQSVKNEVEAVEKTLEVKPPEANAEATANKMGIPEQKLPTTIEKETVKAAESVKDAPAIDVQAVENSAEGDEKAAAEIIKKYDKPPTNRTDLKDGTFYIPTDKFDKINWVPVHGFKVTIPEYENYNFFIAPPVVNGEVQKKGWRICNTETGLAIGETYATKPQALENVAERIKRAGGTKALDMGIAAGLKKQGREPKVEQPSPVVSSAKPSDQWVKDHVVVARIGEPEKIQSTLSASERKDIAKRLKEIGQAKDMAYDMAINDHGKSLERLETEEKELQAKLKADEPKSTNTFTYEPIKPAEKLPYPIGTKLEVKSASGDFQADVIFKGMKDGFALVSNVGSDLKDVEVQVPLSELKEIRQVDAEEIAAVDASFDAAHPGEVEPPVTPAAKPTVEEVVSQVNHEEESRLARQGGTGKMVLMTKALAAQFPKLYSTEKVPLKDKVVIAKFFHPMAGNMTWYATEYDPKEQIFFGYVDTGDYNSEWGEFSLVEMNELKVKGLGMERDLYFKPQKISQVSGLQDRFSTKEEDTPVSKGTYQQDVDVEALAAELNAKKEAAKPAEGAILQTSRSAVLPDLSQTPAHAPVKIPPVGQPLRNKLEEFRDEYRKELRKRLDNNDPKYNWADKSDARVNQVVNSMIGAVQKENDKSRSDWLNNNLAMKAAAKKVGILTSKDFRELAHSQTVTPLMVDTTELKDEPVVSNIDSMRAKQAADAAKQPVIGVDDDVIWHSPFTDEDVKMNFRGYNGDKAVLYNKNTGFQTLVPKDQIVLAPAAAEPERQPIEDLTVPKRKPSIEPMVYGSGRLSNKPYPSTVQRKSAVELGREAFANKTAKHPFEDKEFVAQFGNEISKEVMTPSAIAAGDWNLGYTQAQIAATPAGKEHLTSHPELTVKYPSITHEQIVAASEPPEVPITAHPSSSNPAIKNITVTVGNYPELVQLVCDSNEINKQFPIVAKLNNGQEVMLHTALKGKDGTRISYRVGLKPVKERTGSINGDTEYAWLTPDQIKSFNIQSVPAATLAKYPEINKINNPQPTKPPHEMTQEQYYAMRQKSPFPVEPIEARTYHREYVETALKEGKTVSPEVLKDYPDLVKPVAELPNKLPKKTEKKVKQPKAQRSIFEKVDASTDIEKPPTETPIVTTEGGSVKTFSHPAPKIKRVKLNPDDAWGMDDNTPVRPITSPTPPISGRKMGISGHTGGAHISQHMPRLPKH